MDVPRTYPFPDRRPPSISTAELESFLTEGEQLWPAENPPRLTPIALSTGRAYVAGEVPPTLRSFLDGECGSLSDQADTAEPLDDAAPLTLELSPADVAELRAFDHVDKRREGALGELLFAARELAKSRLMHMAPWNVCMECGAKVLAGHRRAACGKPASHSNDCRVGRVVAAIEKLIALSRESAEWQAAFVHAGARSSAIGFGEPWSTEGGSIVVDGEHFFLKTADESLDLSDIFPNVYRRVVACVNACACASFAELERKGGAQ